MSKLKKLLKTTEETSVAVQFSQSKFNFDNVVEFSQENMYVDMTDSKRFIVIYESQKQLAVAISRMYSNGVTIAYKVLNDYMVDINDLKDIIIQNLAMDAHHANQ